MRKRFLRFWAAALLFCVGLRMWVFPAEASGFNTEVRESVVVVATSLGTPEGEEMLVGWGTGFFVGNPEEEAEYLITNHHVIEFFLDYGKGEYVEQRLNDGNILTVKARVRVYFDSKNYKEAYVIDYNETKDIALLRLASGTSERKALPLCSPTDDMIGSTIYCVGYPGLSDNMIIDATSTWSKTDVSVTAGAVSRFVTSSGTGVRRIQTDAVIQHGNSGGPMVNANGSVIGVDTSSIMNLDEETNYYAVSIDEVIPMLKANSVDYVMESDMKKDGFLDNKILLVGIIVAVAALILIIVLIIIGKSKKGKAQPAALPKKAVIRSLSAQHNGMKYSIGTVPVLIGRDASNCTIVFREGTPGVSGRHCSVSWNPDTGEFLITDLRSTYGTFLMNGQKLEPNVPYRCKAGESFYVGDKTNVLRVEVE